MTTGERLKGFEPTGLEPSSRAGCGVSDHSLDHEEGVGKHLGEGRSVHDGVLPFAVLDDVVGQVHQVEPVCCISCWRQESN